MRKRFIKVAVLCALTATATPVFVGCSDNDDDVARLQGEIDKINSIIGVSGDDMTAAIDAVVKDLGQKIEEISTGLDGKVNTAELTAAVDNLNKLISEKADAGTIQAESERLQSLIEAANKAAADANEADRKALEEQIDQLEQQQEAAQKALDEAIAGKADAATVEGLRTELGTVTASLASHLSEYEALNNLVGKQGDAIAALQTATSDLQALRDRVSALEQADIPSSAEFTALTDRVSDLEAQYGALHKSDSTAIADIKKQIDYFFKDAKTDASVKDIYNRLVALETWKGQVNTQLFTTADKLELTTAVGDIQKLKVQLGLISKDDEGGEGSEDKDTSLFYDKEEIDAKFADLKSRMDLLLGNLIQSFVYIPDYSAQGDQWGGLSFKSLIVKGVNNNNPIVQKKGQQIKFRVSPAAAAAKIAEKYDLDFDGHKFTRGNKPSGFSVELAGADSETGIVTYTVTSGTLNEQYWALCATLKAKDPGKNEDGTAKDKTDFTDITSDYFTVSYKTSTIDGVKVDCDEKNATGFAYKTNAFGDPTSLDYTAGRKYVGTLNGTEVESDLEGAFGTLFTTTYSLKSGGTDNSFFKVPNGVLTTAVASSSENIGKKTTVVATATLNYNTTWKRQTTYSEVTVNDISYKSDLELTKDFVGAAKAASWSKDAYSFDLNSTVQGQIHEQADAMSQATFFGLSFSSTPYTSPVNGKQVTIEADAEAKKIKVHYAEGVIVSAGATVQLVAQISATRSFVITVSLPATATFPEVQEFNKETVGNMWTGNTITFHPTLTTESKNIGTDDEPVNKDLITSVKWEMDLEQPFAKYKDNEAKVTAAGGTVTWTPNNATITGATFDKNEHTLTLGNTYSVHNPNSGLGFGIEINYGGQPYNQSHNVSIEDVSGTWTKGGTPEVITTRETVVNLAKGYQWHDWKGNLIWADGAAVENGAYFGTAFSVLGLGEPTFELVNTDEDKFVKLTKDGKLSLQPGAENWITGETKFKVRVIVKSRFGTVKGYNAGDIIEAVVKL